jgi:hypothetical protein
LCIAALFRGWDEGLEDFFVKLVKFF